MDLQLRQIDSYLRHNIKVMLPNGDIRELTAIKSSGGFYFPGGDNWDTKMYLIKPILRPMSDLVKEIEHNGEKFIPLGWLHYRYCLTSQFRRSRAKYELVELPGSVSSFHGGALHGKIGITIHKDDIGLNEYRIMRWLYKWHFDVEDLIGKGLAIDINEINQQ